MRRVLVLAFLVLAGGSSTACGGRIQVAGLVDRDTQRLAAIVRRRTGCAESPYYVTPIVDRVVRVHACGVDYDYAHPGTQRVGWQPVPPPEPIVAQAWGCPLESLEVTALGPTTRRITGCGTSATVQLGCPDVVCGWSSDLGSSPPPAGAGEPLLATAVALYVPSTDEDPVVPEPPGGNSAEATLREQLDGRRAALLECSGGQPMELRLTWNAEGRLVLPETANSVGSCVSSVLADVTLPSGTPGSAVHTIR